MLRSVGAGEGLDVIEASGGMERQPNAARPNAATPNARRRRTPRLTRDRTPRAEQRG
jgi:hypothetical protein